MRTHGLPFIGAALLAVALAAFLSAGACVETDVGTPCSLQKTSGPDPAVPGCTPQSTEAEQPECFHPNVSDLRAGVDKDFISFGATECDNLTCVRSRCPLPVDPTETPDQRQARCAEFLPATDRDPNGICSAECITDTDCQGEGESSDRFVCRELVLDQEFLAALRETLTEEEYQRYFGRIQNARFCAERIAD